MSLVMASVGVGAWVLVIDAGGRWVVFNFGRWPLLRWWWWWWWWWCLVLVLVSRCWSLMVVVLFGIGYRGHCRYPLLAPVLLIRDRACCRCPSWLVSVHLGVLPLTVAFCPSVDAWTGFSGRTTTAEMPLPVSSSPRAHRYGRCRLVYGQHSFRGFDTVALHGDTLNFVDRSMDMLQYDAWYVNS